MNKPLILLVEDDPPVRNLMKTTLKAHDYRFLVAEDGKQALLEATSHQPDMVLLDLGLPDMDGIDIIRNIRSWSNMPIIVLSARSEDTDKIAALDAGADDYLTKPFSVDELLARLRVSARRLALLQQPALSNDARFVNGPLVVDYGAGCVTVNGKEVHLTPSEYKLLCLLCRHVGKVLTTTFITKEIRGTSWESDIAALRVFMTTLRKKLEQASADPALIQTHIGVGYRMTRLETKE